MPTDVDVIYPTPRDCKIEMLCDDTQLAAHHVSRDRHRWTWRLNSTQPFVYCQPVLITPDEQLLSQDGRTLVITEHRCTEVYPHFFTSSSGTISDLVEVGPKRRHKGISAHRLRTYFPPGYDENTLRRLPVLYMHDGPNLFFPEEAFLNQDWGIGDTMNTLHDMSLIRPAIVVGIYPVDRMYEYTNPGYQEYGRYVVEELKPEVDRMLRSAPGPENCAVMGSSLGGVASFYLAWEWPEVFGMAACMSSTFTMYDNLMQRVAHEPKRKVRFYLDSGWPHDNYEVTRAMCDLLQRRGWEFGRDLLYFGFPQALHDETHWAMRAHLPFQFFFGESRTEKPPSEMLAEPAPQAEGAVAAGAKARA